MNIDPVSLPLFPDCVVVGTIETDTPLLPYVIADLVIHQLAVYLQRHHREEIADTESLADSLAAKAEHIYAHNERFRRRLQSNLGREHLTAFMRHWLTGLLHKSQPAVFAHLPYRFCVGEPPPQ